MRESPPATSRAEDGRGTVIPRRLLLSAGLALAVLLVRTIRDRGGALRFVSLLLHDPTPPRLLMPSAVEESRLYVRRRRRVGAHLSRRPDGRLAVLTLPLDGSYHTPIYLVDERSPWQDFERQAGLVGAPWGPCRDLSAGL